MGGAVVSKEIDFQYKEFYEMWPLYSLQDVFERAGDDASIRERVIQSNEFFEVFNDYSVLTAGQFATIPIDDFKRWDTRNEKRIKVLRPLLLLIICAEPSFVPLVNQKPEVPLDPDDLNDILECGVDAVTFKLHALGKVRSLMSKIDEKMTTPLKQCLSNNSRLSSFFR